MKTHAMDKAIHTATDYLYPFAKQLVGHQYPSTPQFHVVRAEDGTATGIKTGVSFDCRLCIARVSGYAIGESRRHSLQLSSRIHLYDPWFSGLLAHSCKPNVYVDMAYLELWSIVSLPPGTVLTRDYASTEEVLVRQFACHCGELNCRGWITGAKEPLNAEGQAFMAQWRERKRP